MRYRLNRTELATVPMVFGSLATSATVEKETQLRIGRDDLCVVRTGQSRSLPCFGRSLNLPAGAVALSDWSELLPVRLRIGSACFLPGSYFGIRHFLLAARFSLLAALPQPSPLGPRWKPETNCHSPLAARFSPLRSIRFRLATGSKL